jgi:hypothetical protein
VRPKTQSRLDPNLILNKPKYQKAKENRGQQLQKLRGDLSSKSQRHAHAGRRKGCSSTVVHPAVQLSPPYSVAPVIKARRNLYDVIGGKESTLEETLFDKDLHEPLLDPLAPLMTQVERLLISMEQATRRLT